MKSRKTSRPDNWHLHFHASLIAFLSKFIQILSGEVTRVDPRLNDLALWYNAKFNPLPMPALLSYEQGQSH